MCPVIARSWSEGGGRASCPNVRHAPLNSSISAINESISGVMVNEEEFIQGVGFLFYVPSSGILYYVET